MSFAVSTVSVRVADKDEKGIEGIKRGLYKNIVRSCHCYDIFVPL